MQFVAVADEPLAADPISLRRMRRSAQIPVEQLAAIRQEKAVNHVNAVVIKKLRSVDLEVQTDEGAALRRQIDHFRGFDHHF